MWNVPIKVILTTQYHIYPWYRFYSVRATWNATTRDHAWRVFQQDWEDPNTWNTHRGGIGCTLGFLWNPLSEHEIAEQALDKEKRQGSKTASRPSPVYFNALFSIRRQRFVDLGGFNADVFGYGGADNIEFAFRSWLCGGSVQCAPCSRVFIVFYKAHTNGQKHGYSTNQNVLHTAELWMDDYADVVRATLGPRALTAVGRDSAMARTLAASRTRVAQLQSRLQCKSFQWFLDNIYPENEITSLQDIKLLGNFRNEGDKNDSCLDTMARMDFGKPIGLYPCGGIDRLSQSFALLANHHIMPTQRMEMCLGTRLCDTSGTLRYCCRAKDPLLLWRDGLWL
eukprot:m.165921 g.165921  ORF g.165921 m.165921 type:complete len:339 (+) comp18140_c0_seq19:1400-2416(+)